MKLIFLLLFFTEGLCAAYCQSKRANNWYFGYGCGLSFSTPIPSVLNDGQLYTSEGCSTISDEDGKLLFYTDGLKIWNRQHQVMPNGSDLNGHSSSTQSGVIVPYPQHPNWYYVFTVAQLSQISGFCYSIVDMNLDNGLGDVTSKNIQLFTPSSEKITAVSHPNKQDIWVIAHQSKENEFYSYLISNKGINTKAVRSATEIPYLYTGSAMGYLKASPNGKKVAMAMQSDGILAVYDFDNLTGKLTLFRSFNACYNCYGVEFSPDNSKLYYTTSRQVHQVNVNDSQAEPVLIGTYDDMRDALQLAPNGKIYMACTRGNLNVIDSPNAEGTACSYQTNVIDLGEKCMTGLPSYIQSYFLPNIEMTFYDTCLGLPTYFTVISPNIQAVQWNFGDGSTSSFINSSHTYSKSGTYTVQIVVTYQNGTSQSLSQTITILERPKKLTINHD